MPALFITHGGGPMPLLSDAMHAPLTAFLEGAARLLPARLSAIVVVTAHWMRMHACLHACWHAADWAADRTLHAGPILTPHAG